MNATSGAPSLAANDVTATSTGSVFALASNKNVDLINGDGSVTNKYSETDANYGEYRRIGAGPDGRMFLEGYYGNGVTLVEPDSSIKRVGCDTDEGPNGVAVSGNGTAYVTGNYDPKFCIIDSDGRVKAQYFEPFGSLNAGLALDNAGDLWSLELNDSSFTLNEMLTNGQVRQVGTQLPFTGTLPSPPRPGFSGTDLTIDSAGDVFFTDGDYHIYERKSDGSVVVVAGTGQAPTSGAGNGDGGPATAAQVNAGTLALDSSGNLYLTQGDANVREIVGASPFGVASPRSGPTPQTMASYPSSGLGSTELPAGSNPSEVCGCGQRQATNKPVDTASGAFWHSFTDMQTAGRGPSLSATRTYSSAESGVDGIFGYGWTSPWNMSLGVDAATGNITVDQEDGSQVAFAASGSTYAPVQPRILAALQANTDGTYTFTRRARQKFTFSSAGQLTKIADLNGNATTLGYDGSGNLNVVTAASGRSYAIGTTNGRITSVTDGAGRSTAYTYDQDGNLKSATDPTGAKWTYTYDASHRLLTMLDPNQQGATTPTPLTNVYDSSGRVTTQTDAAGRATTFDYSSIAGATKTTDPVGNITVDYYTNGLRSKTTVGYGTSAAASTNYTYDSATEAPATVVDPRTKTTAYTYDTRGNTLTVTDPLNHTTTNTYDALDDLLTSTDPNGVTITNTYDTHGNLTSTSTPLLAGNGSTTATRTASYTYADSSNPGLPTSIIDPNNHTTAITYDTYGDLISSTAPPTPENPVGDKTTNSYNPNTGWRLTTVSPKGNLSGATASNYTTSFSYDADGRLVQTKDALWTSGSPTLHQSSTAYDLDGDTTSATDADGHVTSYVYNRDGELVTTNLPNSTSTQQSWTADGQLATTTDASGRVTTNTYDSVNHLVSKKDPLNRTTAYSYDLDGNKVLTAAPGATCTGNSLTAGCTANTYDAANELTARSYLDGGTANVTYTYDADGRRTGMTDGSGTSSYTYDSLGRLTSSADGDGVAISYGYDLVGNQTSLTYPGGNVRTRTYDALNRMASETDWQSSTLTFSYDADSNPIGTVFPSTAGETDTNTYNTLDQLTSITDSHTASGTTSTLANFAYTRDTAGQLASSTTTGVSEASQSYSRNSINNLTASGPSATPTTYGYTPTNDISNRGTSSTAANTQAFNADDQLCWSSTTTVSSPACTSPPAAATTYTYDSSGNRTQTSTPATGPGITIDKSVSADTTGATGTVTTPTFSTTTAGETLIALTANSMAASGTRTVTVSGAGLTWTLVTRDTIRDGDSEIWKATAPAALTNVSVSAVQAASNRTHQTLTVIALKGAAGVGASAQAGAAGGAPSVSLTTTAAGSMIFATGNDYYNATTRTVATGQTMVHEFSDTSTAGPGYTGDDYWAQRTTATTGAAGSTITMSDSAPTTDEFNLAAVEVIAQGPAQATGYHYNEANELTSYTAPNGVVTTYTYDGDGLRQSKTTGGTTVYFNWEHDTSTPLLLADGTHSYIYGTSDSPVEQIDNTGGTTWLHDDQLGSVRLLTDYFGNVVGTNTYDPYGTRTSATGPVTSPLGYNGQYTDAESGLIYLRARYYEPTTAQFLTVDPLLPVTGQPYAYADDEPTDWSDPTGLCSHWNPVCDLDSASSHIANSVANGAKWIGHHPGEALTYAAVAVTVVALTVSTAGVGDTVILGGVAFGGADAAGGITVTAAADTAATVFAAGATDVDCAKGFSASCALDIASLGLGGAGALADYGFARPALGLVLGATSLAGTLASLAYADDDC